MVKQHSETIMISDVTLAVFDEFYPKHYQKLTCPCSTTTISYHTFVNNTNQLYPICSSIFITEQWTRALYFSNASTFGTADFRTIANSQVKSFHVYSLIKIFVFSFNFCQVFVHLYEMQLVKMKSILVTPSFSV